MIPSARPNFSSEEELPPEPTPREPSLRASASDVSPLRLSFSRSEPPTLRPASRLALALALRPVSVALLALEHQQKFISATSVFTISSAPPEAEASLG